MRASTGGNDGSLALTGLAASLTMAVLLAATAAIVLRFGGLPRWFGWTSAASSATRADPSAGTVPKTQ